MAEFREITDYLKSCCKGETVKKAAVLNLDDINNFFSLASVKSGFSKYIQVRAVVAAVALPGGRRMEELKGLVLLILIIKFLSNNSEKLMNLYS